MRLAPFTIATAALALGLSACGSGSDEAREAAANLEAKQSTAKLGPIQQASYDRMNRQEVSANYRAIVEGMDPAMLVPPKADMNMEWLDQDKDGKISVAEFALWEFPVTPGDTSELSDEQLSQAASNFFANDTDGDQFLSATEFASATGQPAPVGEDEPADKG